MLKRQGRCIRMTQREGPPCSTTLPPYGTLLHDHDFLLGHTNAKKGRGTPTLRRSHQTPGQATPAAAAAAGASRCARLPVGAGKCTSCSHARVRASSMSPPALFDCFTSHAQSTQFLSQATQSLRLTLSWDPRMATPSCFPGTAFHHDFSPLVHVCSASPNYHRA